MLSGSNTAFYNNNFSDYTAGAVNSFKKKIIPAYIISVGRGYSPGSVHQNKYIP
ncbi:MAG TPA: hypothetical protein VKS21_01690 [Spirochaetota bacterium]|nr:hypothetical protein [Spirochaetota bacterium]